MARRHPVLVALTALLVVVLAAVAVASGRLGGGSGDRAPGSGGGPFVRSVPGAQATVWAVGDGDARADGRAVAARIARGRPDRFLYLGDVYENGTAAEFRTGYAPSYGRLARITAPVSGNHDARSQSSGYDPYWRRVHGRTPPDWYRFSAGGWTLLALDSEAAHDRGSPQERWLRRQLRGRGTCRIAFWHRARLSAGPHGDQADMAPLWDALRGHATIVLSGHDHDLQRFRPSGGLTQFVAGAGGRGLYPLRADRRLAFGNDSTYGALRLQLRRGSARWAFVSAAGRTLDRGTLRCRP